MIESYRRQYIEILIRLLELNHDRQWDEIFYGLRNGGYLPGGGAGSLNDWDPIYKDTFEKVWWSFLYDLVRYLFDRNLTPENLTEYIAHKNANVISAITCLNCAKSSQHPDVFEKQIAVKFYTKNLPRLLEQKQCEALFDASLTFNSDEANFFRQNLKNKYDAHDIRIGIDTENGLWKCHNCGSENGHEFLTYQILGEPEFQLIRKTYDDSFKSIDDKLYSQKKGDEIFWANVKEVFSLRSKDWMINVFLALCFGYLAYANYSDYERLFTMPAKGWSFRQTQYLQAFNLFLDYLGGKFLVVGFYLAGSVILFFVAYKLLREHLRKKATLE